MFEVWCGSEGFHSATKCNEYTGAYLKGLYTSGCFMRNKQKELEILSQSQNYDIIDIMSWFSPDRHLSTTRPLVHFSPGGMEERV